jgi:single-strand DNA-binding protein
MNVVILGGRVGTDARITQTQGGRVASFRLATDEGKAKNSTERKTEWHNIVAWDNENGAKNATFVERFCQKGEGITLRGRLQTREYEKDGQKKYTTEIVVDRFDFPVSRSSKATGDASVATAATNGTAAHAAPVAAGHDAPAPSAPQDDDSIPF